MNKIYILLPVHNRKKITEAFIQCLKVQTYTYFQLILIDDGSTDGTADMVLSYIPDAIVIRGNGSWWWGGSLQQGYDWLKKNKQISEEDYVLIINDDTTFLPDFIETGISIIKNKQRTLLLAQSYDKNTEEFVDAGVHVDWLNLEFKPVEDTSMINCLSTRGLFLRVKDLFSIGKFHPVLLPHYGSDYEYTMRAYKKGFLLTTDKSLVLYMDIDTTGFHAIDEKSKIKYLKKIFSKRSALNPFYWTMFILLSCPRKYIIRVIYTGFIKTMKSFKNR